MNFDKDFTNLRPRMLGLTRSKGFMKNIKYFMLKYETWTCPKIDDKKANKTQKER